MKVETLIKKLEQMNPKAEVRVNDYNGDTALFVNAKCNDKNVVWIEGEHDIDLGEEISAQYEHAIEEQMDELDFYMNLLEIGITVDMVRDYISDERADAMEMFCNEHGLI